MTASLCDHTSVGIIVRNATHLLLIERKKPPFGFACPAGHVDDHGTYEQAAAAELAEEVGLSALKLTLVHQERLNNSCRRLNGSWHYWKVFEAEVSGLLVPSPEETRAAFWASPEQIIELKDRTRKYLRGGISEWHWKTRPGLEPVWAYLFDQIIGYQR